MADCKLVGHVIGPECRYAQTLPARVPLVDRGSGKTLLAEAVLPEPCFWTPELPFLYRVEIELRTGGETHGRRERLLGLRRLGVRGKSLVLDGKRWVLRGVSLKRSPFGRGQREGRFSVDDLQIAHDSAAVVIVEQPTDQVCEQASRVGVLIAAKVSGGHDTAVEIARLARWPSVGIILLPASFSAGHELRQIAPNLMLAQHLPLKHEREPASWAQIVFQEINDSYASLSMAGSNPVVIWRREPSAEDIGTARAAVDRLQCDMASFGDFAGYVV
jgi:hypothetical protein